VVFDDIDRRWPMRDNLDGDVAYDAGGHQEFAHAGRIAG
jgi:hypothetical protein